ncbi:MAG: RidA family protein [Pseudomonadota bacterium]
MKHQKIRIDMTMIPHSRIHRHPGPAAGLFFSLVGVLFFASTAQANDLPYSPVVEANGFIFLAGKIGVDPETGELPGDIYRETGHALRAIRKELSGVGASMADVVRCQVFLADIDDFDAMNGVYKTFFTTNPPARTTVAVKDIVAGAKIEIECTAARRAETSPMKKAN